MLPARLLARAVLAVVLAGLAVLGAAAPAGAHATLVATDPAEGAVLSEAPAEVTFTFNEHIRVIPDGVQVFDATGAPTAAEATASGEVLTVALTGAVGTGTQVVVWRILSDDGHPVSGSLTFAVGSASDTVATPAGALADTTQEGAPLLLGVLRWMGYAALLLGAGVLAFVLLFLPDDPQADRPRRRLVALVRVAAPVAALTWVAALPFAITYQLGVDAAALGDGSTWAAVQPVEYGVLAAVGLGMLLSAVLLGSGRPAPASRGAALVAAGLAVAAPALTGHTRAITYQLGVDAAALGDGSTWAAVQPVEYGVLAAVGLGMLLSAVLLGSGRPAPASRGAALVAAGLAVAAPALTGHTRAITPEPLMITTDVLHLLAAAVWFGGLVALALTLRDLADRGTLGGETLARFSVAAAGVLAALVVSGTLLGWRVVGSWSALVGTGYGQLLLLKVLLALVAIAIAGWNRQRLLPQLQATTRRRDRRGAAGLVARAVSVEAGVLVAVLLATGFLVDRSPEEEASVAAVAPEPVETTGKLGDVEVTAVLAPPTTGPTTVTITMTDEDGEPFEGYAAPTLSLRSEGVDLGALTVRSVAPGSYAADTVIPTQGTWRLQVSLRVTEFDNPVTTLDLEVTE